MEWWEIYHTVLLSNSLGLKTATKDLQEEKEVCCVCAPGVGGGVGWGGGGH